MGKAHDIIIVGGGHNGLTAAAYLARAGLDVCVLERKNYVGGGVVTLEPVMPGVRHDMAAAGHLLIQANPLILNDELGLKAKYGLKYLMFEDKPAVTIIFPDNRYLELWKDVDKTCHSIAKFSAKDAESYRKLYEVSKPMLGLLMNGYFSPPISYGSLFTMLEQPGSPTAALARIMFMSAYEFFDEWFENEWIKAAFGRWMSEGNYSPDQKGGAVMVFMMIPLLHAYGFGAPQGGSGELCNALVKSIQADGGTVLTNSDVKHINISDDRASGVVLATGEEFTARKAVVANVHVKQLAGLVGEKELGEEFCKSANNIIHSFFAPMHDFLVVKEAPILKAGKHLMNSCFVQFTPSLQEQRKSYDAMKYGEYNVNMLCFSAPSLGDPTRGAPGKFPVGVYSTVPYNLANGGSKRWERDGHAVSQEMRDFLESRCENMGPDNILDWKSMTPVDFERWNISWPHGDFMHLASSAAQQFTYRPFPSHGKYHMPVRWLYLTGPSAHPGGGVTGGSRATVITIMNDMGMDFNKKFMK